METILITGVAGFIGSNIAKRFISEGFQVVGVDDLSSGNKENIPSGIDFIEGDLTKKSILKLLPKNCGKILHLAGQSSGEISFENPCLDLEKNTVSTLNLIEYGIQVNAEKIVYASSMSVYGNVGDRPVTENQKCHPLSCYGVGKLASEGYLSVYKKQLPCVIMRMFNVYGPGQDLRNLKQGMVSIYLAQALENSKITVKGSLDRYRDFIFIDDVVEAWWRAAITKDAFNEIYNIATGMKTTVTDLLQSIINLLPNVSYVTSESTPGDQNGIYADVSLVKKKLGLTKFVSLRKGLELFLRSISIEEASNNSSEVF